MYPAIELRDLVYVVAVSEELHFRRAALRVHVAQPSLSKQIRDLEDTLGVRLFERTKRQVRITAAGRQFVKEAKKVLFHCSRAVDVAKAAASPDTNGLSVGYSPQMNLRLLSMVHTLASSQRPALKLRLLSAHTHDQIEGLLEGTLHAGLVTLPVRNESLIVKSLVREPLAIALPRQHPFANKADFQLSELNGQSVISTSRQLSPSSYDHLHSVFRRLGYKPNVTQEVSSEAEALHMVRDGMGIAFVKMSALRGVDNEIVCRRLPEASLAEETGIAYRRDNRWEVLQDLVMCLRRSAAKGLESPLENGTDCRQLKLF
jgi:DNA-binding transcriptional LysR family regulator